MWIRPLLLISLGFMAVKFILALEGSCCVDICLTGFPCHLFCFSHILFWGFGLVFYIRLCPYILFWGFGLIFYIELCPHILFWGFGLVFYFEASSSYFILRLCPHILFWGFGLPGFVLHSLHRGFVLNFMDSSIVFFVVVLSTVSERIRLLCLQETCLHCWCGFVHCCL